MPLSSDLNTRKKLGIIGGMGSEATAVFIKCIFDNTLAATDQDHLDILVYNHASLPDRTAMILNGKTNELAKLLIMDTKMLLREGSDYIAVPCNTCHYFANELRNAANGGFINMLEETALELLKMGSSVVGITATDGTVKSGLYERALLKYGIKAVYPNEAAQKTLMNIIYTQVKRGLPTDIGKYMEVADSLFAMGCDRIILGCTELSVLKSEHSLNDDRFVDALSILAKACIKKCGGRIKVG